MVDLPRQRWRTKSDQLPIKLQLCFSINNTYTEKNIKYVFKEYYSNQKDANEENSCGGEHAQKVESEWKINV